MGYFDFGSFTDTERVTDSVPVLFGGVPARAAPSYDISNESQFSSLELNAWVRKSLNYRFGIGLRHVQYEDQFDVIETGSNNSFSNGTGFFSDAENELYGVQVMGECL